MTVHKPNNTAAAHLAFETLVLEKGEEKRWRSETHETVAVITEGACTVSAQGQTWNLHRQSVFTQPASAVFASPGTELIITASEPTTLALCQARATKKFPAVFVPQEKVKEEWRGQEGYRRRVFNIVSTETETERIAVGETINEPGQWSSFPPHKHDKHEEVQGQPVENPLEEIYYFRVEPNTGFAFQRLYTPGNGHDEACVIKDGDVSHIPSGYHPVAGMPGHRVYYLWMLGGDKRLYIWNTDPAFRWMEKK